MSQLLGDFYVNYIGCTMMGDVVVTAEVHLLLL